MNFDFNQANKDLALVSRPDISKNIAVLILANNEADVIETSIRSIKPTLAKDDAVFVIADNCQDNTAERAVVAGAIVYPRYTNRPDGKGAALRWFIEQAGDLLSDYNLIVILDADSQVPGDFLRQVKVSYQEGIISQFYVQPAGYRNSTLGTLIALSEIHEQTTVDRLRNFFGWPVRLRGTGMMMTPTQLGLVADKIATEVEDIALSLLFASRGFQIQWTDQTYVLDPKPNESRLASQQRARWFRGQWIALWHYRCEVAQLALRGPGGWALLGSLFIKPRWLVNMILIIAAMILARYSWILACILLVKVLFDLTCLGITILNSTDRTLFLKAMLHLPGFITMWIRSIFLTFKKTPWLRARP